jgi:hypothetical protein
MAEKVSTTGSTGGVAVSGFAPSVTVRGKRLNRHVILIGSKGWVR